MSMYRELRKRRVLQTAALYFAVAWGATEIITFLIDRIPVFPPWLDTVVAVLFILGFPLALFLAWMFDIGPGGIRRADPASPMGRGIIVVSALGVVAATAALSYVLIPMQGRAPVPAALGDFDTIAVLPFDNLTSDPDLDYLASGLAEDIRQRLSAHTRLEVVGRFSASEFAAGKTTDIAELRRMLGAGLILDGTVQASAGRVRITTTLVETSTGRQVWSHTFGAVETGLEATRHRIVSAIQEQLALTVRLIHQSDNPADIPDQALKAYLSALANLHQPKVADAFFDDAIRHAPDFADAYARKALLRYDMLLLGLRRPDAWEEAAPLIAKARELDPGNLLADIAEGHLLWAAQSNPFAALVPLENAARSAPGHPLVLAGLGTVLRYLDRVEEALVHHQRYRALDPLNPDTHLRLAGTLMFDRQLDAALASIDRAIELDPTDLRAYQRKGNHLYFMNRVVDSATVYTLKGELENPMTSETEACMTSLIAPFLPVSRGEDLLRRVAERRRDRPDEYIGFCDDAASILPIYLAMNTDRHDEAHALAEQTGPGEAAYVQSILARKRGDGPAMLEFWLNAMPITLEEWLGPDPPVNHVTREAAGTITRALKLMGRTEDARRLGRRAAEILIDFAGPGGFPGHGAVILELLAAAGAEQEALEYVEDVGPDGFLLWTHRLLRNGFVAHELLDYPRYQEFLDELEARWQTELAALDAAIERGEVVLP